MKWFTFRKLFPLICLLVSLIIAESFSNRKIRNKSFPRTPPIQVNRRLMKRKPFPQSKPVKQKKPINPKIKKRQFIVPFARPAPAGLFSNNLARALLIPAIPTLIGKFFNIFPIFKGYFRSWCRTSFHFIPNKWTYCQHIKHWVTQN